MKQGLFSIAAWISTAVPVSIAIIVSHRVMARNANKVLRKLLKKIRLAKKRKAVPRAVQTSAFPRRLARKVAKAKMAKSGIHRVNRYVSSMWRDYV